MKSSPRSSRPFLLSALVLCVVLAVGARPAVADPVPGSDGNSYGTTRTGGTSGNGTFYRVTPGGATTVLYNFTGGTDGGAPNDGLVAGGDGTFYGTTSTGGSHGVGTAFQATTAGALSTLFSLGSGGGGTSSIAGFVRGADAHVYGTGDGGGFSTIFKLLSHPAYFDGQVGLDSGVYYLTFSSGNPFGYYSFLADANYIYHFDLGYEYVFDAADGNSGVYLYDFQSQDFFYTSPTFPFPYLYDFGLNTVLYYYPDPTNTGHYNTDGYRFFYRFDTGQIIVK